MSISGRDGSRDVIQMRTFYFICPHWDRWGKRNVQERRVVVEEIQKMDRGKERVERVGDSDVDNI